VTGPLVTIVLPVYNGAAFVGEAIESVLAQTYEPIELIVVDDGSTDGSADVARRYDGIRLIQQENRGAGPARNTGIAAATGEFIGFVDADDLATRTKVEVQVGYLLEHPETDAVLGRQQWINPPEGLARDERFGDLDGIPIGSMVVRRHVFDVLGGHDDERGGDLDFLVRMREHGFGIEVLDAFVLIRRYHGANLVAGRSLTPLPPSSLKAKLDRERARAAEAAQP
jgi:glycosyltransferase involved in cell wall biosynthesis